jgi:hypothetical protein
MSNNVFIEYLHYDNGAKYNLISNSSNLNITTLCPGLENIVLQSTELIKIQGTNLIFEYSRFLFNGQTVSSLTTYAPAIDWTLGDRSNINSICLWVIGGLVDFDMYLNKIPSIMQLLGNKKLPINELKELLIEISQTYGKWIDHEETLGFSWAKDTYDRKTSIIKQSLDLPSTKKLIKDLSRFGDGIAFFNQLKDASRIFIDPESKLNISATINGKYNHDEDDIIASIIKKIASNKTHLASEIDNLSNQSRDYKIQIDALNEQLRNAQREIEKNILYVSNLDSEHKILNEFKQAATQLINSNNSINHIDGYRRIEANLNSLRQQLGASKPYHSTPDSQDDQDNNHIWNYSLIGIISLLIIIALGFGVYISSSNPKSTSNNIDLSKNSTIMEIISTQNIIIKKLDDLSSIEKNELKVDVNESTPQLNSKKSENNYLNKKNN